MSEIKDLALYRRLYPNAEVIIWAQLYNSIMNRQPTKDMINGSVAILEKCRKKGDTREIEPETRIVIYDVSYVILKIVKANHELIKELSIKDWNALMTSAYWSLKSRE